jgi:methylglutaconyl-CoA hydratase
MRASLGCRREDNEQDAMVLAEMLDAIDRCPCPLSPACMALAWVAEWAFVRVSDIVIAESGARFGFTETRLGILPAVISPFVIAKIGESHARALFPGGAASTPPRPAHWPGSRGAGGQRRARLGGRRGGQGHSGGGPTAARAAKAIVREVRGLPHESTRWHTARKIATQRTSSEGQEGLKAFLEKREPAWRDEGGLKD